MFFVGETCFWGKCRLLRCFNLIFVYYYFFFWDGLLALLYGFALAFFFFFFLGFFGLF
jgi:hypothetical protein